MRAAARPPSRGADQGLAVLSTMISGMVVFGGIGWSLDRWWDARLWTPIGLVLGISLGIYAIVMRFGRSQTDQPTGTPVAPRAAENADLAAALRAAKAANRQQAFSRARAVAAQMTASSPADGPPSAGIRRETECP